MSKIVDTIPSPVMEFVQTNLLKHQLVAVLLVGSSSRGYALDNSDLDFMAFYEAPGLESYPHHDLLGNQKVTMEHHDLISFLCGSGDFSVNPGSLRQLCKVRDGIVVLGEEHRLQTLREVAHRAALDPRPALALLASIARRSAMIRDLSPLMQHQTIISWSELLATMVMVTTPGAPAYSKPKWLLHALSLAGHGDAVALICSLYPEIDKLRLGLSAVDDLKKAAAHRGLSENQQRLLATMMNDTIQMVDRKPKEAWPALRFAMIQTYRAANGVHPLDVLKSNGQLPVEILMALGSSEPLDMDQHWTAFNKYAASVHKTVANSCLKRLETRIGTTRFMTHLLNAYQANELFPYVTETLTKQWLEESQNQWGA